MPVHSQFELFFFSATMIGFMEIICVLQAHDEFLVSLCLVVIICPGSFKEVIVVMKAPEWYMKNSGL